MICQPVIQTYIGLIFRLVYSGRKRRCSYLCDVKETQEKAAEVHCSWYKTITCTASKLENVCKCNFKERLWLCTVQKTVSVDCWCVVGCFVRLYENLICTHAWFIGFYPLPVLRKLVWTLWENLTLLSIDKLPSQPRPSKYIQRDLSIFSSIHAIREYVSIYTCQHVVLEQIEMCSSTKLDSEGVSCYHILSWLTKHRITKYKNDIKKY